jgi:uncharacterized protein YndB with AHSA1/START domain
MTNTKTQIQKDLKNKKITIIREFSASVEPVWKFWTEKELLDQWWAPKPWKAQTKTLDFSAGGFWLYCMVGPDGTKMWARLDFNTITKFIDFTATNSFCDETGSINLSFPNNHWKNDFHKTGTGTKIVVEISFSSEIDLEKMVEMGFEEGFTAALNNLEELLKK